MTDAGHVSDYRDFDALKKAIDGSFSSYQKGKLEVNPAGVEQFSRKELAKQYAALLDQL